MLASPFRREREALPARDTSGGATELSVIAALDAALSLNVEGVLDAALWRKIVTRVRKDADARGALGRFAEGAVQKGVTKRAVPVLVILTLLYKMLWHAKTVLRHNPSPQAMEREGERRFDDAKRTERFLSQLNSDALDVMHGFARVNPTLVSPGVLRAAAELRAFFQHYAAAGPNCGANSEQQREPAAAKPSAS
jgi:hypothetical protein